MTFSRLRQHCNSLCNFLHKINPAHAKGRNTVGYRRGFVCNLQPPRLEGVAHVAGVGAKPWRRAQLMTFCKRVGVNGVLCSREKNVFNQECGITCLKHFVVIGTFRRCTKLTCSARVYTSGKPLKGFSRLQ